MSNFYLHTRRGFVPTKDHIHKLIREDITEDGEKYKYRCIDCGQRLKRISGVIVERNK